MNFLSLFSTAFGAGQAGSNAFVQSEQLMAQQAVAQEQQKTVIIAVSILGGLALVGGLVYLARRKS